MSQTATQDPLEQFAAMSSPGEGANLPAVQQAPAMPANRATGAQQVAVRRDEHKALQKIKALGAAAGDKFYYRFPVKDNRNNRTTYVEGPSIKLANELARIIGNLEIDTVVHDLGQSWMIYARVTDIETGASMTRPFQQRKNASKMGGSDDARRQDMALQIGVSKAIRNVVVNMFSLYADEGVAAAKRGLAEKIGRDIEHYRGRILQALQDENVDPRRVERVVGRKAADWLAPDMAKVIAVMQAIADGMTTWQDNYPPLDDDNDDAGGPSDAEAADAADVQDFTAEKERKAAEPADTKAPAKSEAKAKPKADTKPAAKKAEPKPEPEKKAEPKGEPAPETDADATGGEPSQAALDEAYERGRKAHGRGMSARAVPPELRQTPALVDQWRTGFEDAKIEAEGGDGER